MNSRFDSVTKFSCAFASCSRLKISIAATPTPTSTSSVRPPPASIVSVLAREAIPSFSFLLVGCHRDFGGLGLRRGRRRARQFFLDGRDQPLESLRHFLAVLARPA